MDDSGNTPMLAAAEAGHVAGVIQDRSFGNPANSPEISEEKAVKGIFLIYLL